MLSDAEKQFVIQGIEGNHRSDGRTFIEQRDFQVELGAIPQAAGSAKISFIGGGTEVLVGVKMDLVAPDPQAPTMGILTCTIDPSGDLSFATDPSAFRTFLSILLSDSLQKPSQDSSSSSSSSKRGWVDLSQLCVLPGKQVWEISIDVLVLSSSGGNVVGASVLACKAALLNTRYAHLTVVQSSEGDPIVELEADIAQSDALSVAELPVLVAISKIGRRYVLDPSQEEESCAASTFYIFVFNDNMVGDVCKTGSGSVDLGLLEEILQCAIERGADLHTKLNAALSAPRSSSSTSVAADQLTTRKSSSTQGAPIAV